jgi:hypothetical protein
MAQSFKQLTDNDRVTSSTELVEAKSLTRAADYGYQIRYGGSDASNSSFYVYGVNADPDVENLGISFGITAGYSSIATITTLPAAQTIAQRVDTQFRHLLLGYKANGDLKKFSDVFGGTNMPDGGYIYLSIPRNSIKDKIASGSFEITINGTNECEEYGTSYEVQTGEARLLKLKIGSTIVGAVFYEAGIVVLKASNTLVGYPGTPSANTLNVLTAKAASNNGVTAISFNAVTELNSAIYFCRAYNNEFNYSANPTYLEDSMIRVKESDPTKESAAYITTVGLYDSSNQLLAVAKLSEPIKKTPSTELIMRVRLDF